MELPGDPVRDRGRAGDVRVATGEQRHVAVVQLDGRLAVGLEAQAARPHEVRQPGPGRVTLDGVHPAAHLSTLQVDGLQDVGERVLLAVRRK